MYLSQSSKGIQINPTAIPPLVDFPLFTVYSDIFNFYGGTPVPLSNTRYWQAKLTIPSGGTVYTSIGSLNTAIASATAGDILKLQDGTYSSAVITINSTGTAANPITVCGETADGVFFTNDSEITIGGDFNDVLAFDFSNTTSNVPTVIQVDGDNNLISLMKMNSLLSDQALLVCINFQVDGFTNRVCYNTITDKRSRRQVFHPGFSGNGVGGVAQYNRFDHNRVVDHTGDDGQGDSELIQMSPTNADKDSFTLFDNNYILRWNNIGGVRSKTNEAEISSIKCSRNAFIQNIFEACCGHNNCRTSHRTTFYANWYLGKSAEWTGGNHLGGDESFAFCNYYSNMNPTDTAEPSVDFRKGGTNQHEPSVDNEAAFNTIINADQPVAFGQNGLGVEAPTDNRFYNNAVDKGSAGTDSIYKEGPADVGTVYGGNIIQTPVGVVDAGINAATPDLTLDNGVFVPTDSGNCDGTGVSGYSSIATVDILGTSIPASNPNVGCFQDGWSFEPNPVTVIINAAGA